ncbi:hypothetical protein CF327_g4735 [Tilletia walkeri]|nr:hypothetical protein CF327_g4735 [Tilletia walkeri]
MQPPPPFSGLSQLGDAPDPTLSNVPALANVPTASTNQIPADLLMAYPFLAQLLANQASSSPAPAASSTPATSATVAPTPAAQQVPVDRATELRQQSQRPLSSFPNGKDILWTESAARKAMKRYSKQFVTRDEDGRIISDERKDEIEAGVNLLTEEAKARLKKEHPEDKELITNINFKEFKENYIDTLMDLARRVGEQFPELAWCEMYYKPFIWIMLHLKSHKDGLRKKAVRLGKTKENGGASSTSKKISSTKQTSQSTKKRPASNNAKTASTSARKLTPDPFADVEDSGEDEPKSKKQRSNAPTAVQRLNQLAKERGLDMSNDESDEEMEDVDGEMGDTHETNQGAVKSAADLQETAGTRTSGMVIPVRAQASANSISKENTIPVHKASSAASKAAISRPAPTSASRPATDANPTTQKGSKLSVPFKITTAAPASTQRASQATSAVPSPALGNMRAVDASKLEDPTAAALRSALQVRFSELPETEEVDDALQLLETVDACGASKESNGDPTFVAWLEELEKLDPATIDDEDELGECFGHRAIGRWKYDAPLSNADTWGRTADAFKLLSALLRIWHIGRQQLIDQGSSTQPLVHNHIAKVCARIKLAFKIGSSNTQSSTQNAEAGPSTGKTDKKRARVSMELKQGVITADAIKRLSKKDATQILKSANIKFKSGALRSDIIDILIEAHTNGRIKLTADQIRYPGLSSEITDE